MKKLVLLVLLLAIVCLAVPLSASGGLMVYDDCGKTDLLLEPDLGELEQGSHWPAGIWHLAVENNTQYELTMTWEYDGLEGVGGFALLLTSPYTLPPDTWACDAFHVAILEDAELGDHYFHVLITGSYYSGTGLRYFTWNFYPKVTVIEPE